MGLQSVPTEEAASLASLVNARKGTVASRSLTKGEGINMTLFAFAEGESVSEEIYPQDVMYLQVEGAAAIVFADRRVSLAAGEAIAVPAGTSHAVEPAGSDGFKVLQVFVPVA